MRKTRLFLYYCCVLILSPVISLFLFPLAAVSAAPLDKLQISSLSDAPDPFSPNNDGRLDVVTITSVLKIEGTGQTANAILKGELAVQDASGKQVASLEVGKQLLLDIGKWNATTFSSGWDGKTANGEIVADGTYFYIVDLSLLKGCKGNGDNRDDLHSGQVDLLGDCNSGEGNDTKGDRIITTASPLSGEMTVDNTPPSITVEGTSDGGFSNQGVTPTISIFDPNIAIQSILLNNQPFLSGTPVTEEGHYALSIIAEDRAENSSKVDLEFTIDKTPPTVNILSPTDGSQLDTSNPQIFIEYSDSLSGIDLSTVALTIDHLIVTSDAQITEAGMTYSPLFSLQEGPHTIVISASDMSGNMAEKSATFTIRSRCAEIKPVRSNSHPTNPYIFPEPQISLDSNVKKVADVNRDGYLDIVGKSWFYDSSGKFNYRISVLLGKGDGTFDNYENFVEKSDAYDILSIELGDFNGDCYPDIAVTRSWPCELSLFLNNGDGSFTEKSVYGIEDRSAFLTGKFDEDEYEDIVVYNSSGKVTLYKGHGDGTFSVPVTLIIDSSYANLIDMTVLDLNEDGRTDLVAIMGEPSSWGTTTLQGREIVLLMGSRQEDFIQSSVYIVDDNQNIAGVVAGDYNGDGHGDIAALRQPDNGVYYIGLNLTTFLGDGSGGLAIQADEAIWAEFGFIYDGFIFDNASVLDMNGDNNDDIAIVGDGKFYVYSSNGDGTFRYTSSFNIQNNWGGINTGDFDGDGYNDVISGGFVLFNRGDGTFIDRRKISTYNGREAQLVTADFDGDNRPDLVTTEGLTWGYAALFSTILNRSDDWSDEPFRSSHSTSYDIVGGPRSLKVGDLDHDGHLDVVTANKAAGNVAVLANNGDGSLKPPVYFQTGQRPDHLALADLNGDDRLDIITANEGSGDVSILLGKGDGSFQKQKTSTAGASPGGLAVGDFNRDGRPDLAVTNSSWGSSEVSILLGNGDGTFQERVLYSVNGMMPSTIKEGDFNNDGFSDLAVLYVSASGWWGVDKAIDLLLGKGDGTFLVTKLAAGGGDNFISADFNRDDTLDIVIFDTNSDRITVLIGDGNGRFTRNQLFGQSITWPAVSGDIDNDGEIDLLIQNVGSLTPWFGQSNGTLVERGVSIGARYAMALDLGDIDGDGIMDIVAVEDELKLSVILGTGGGSFQGVAVVNEDEPYSSLNLVTGDFNGDGNQDVAVSLYPSEGACK